MRDLKLGALHDIESDGAPAFPVLRALGAEARAELVDGDGAPLALTPGEYLFELRARAMQGTLAPRLAAALAGGGEREAMLSEVEPGAWRCALAVERSVASLSVAFPGAVSFIFGGAGIVVGDADAEDAPSLSAGAVTMARALFRKLPQAWRRALLASGRRARWLSRLRKAQAEAPEQGAGGRALGRGEDGAHWRAGFEDRLAVARGLRHPAYTDEAPASPPQGAARLIAFHLPQFHPIPENDAWWGKGFTEWSNVAKAQAQFLGHYQPRLPGELGFYDLRTPGVLAQQAQLARAYGISAFCFHYYWFAGKRLLEAPIEAFLADRSIDIGFCLCWANENWTRRWDGDDSKILIAQEHTLEDHARVFDDLARHMEDPRYLRVDGKPLLVVYRPDIIAQAAEMTALWREAAAQRGWPGLYLVAANAFRFDEPERLGFEALAEFPPHGIVADAIASRLSWLNPGHAGAVYDYGAVADAEVRRLQSAPARGVVFPGVMPGWDNEARRPGAGVIYHDATPAAYGAWLSAAIARAARTLPADRRFVFINAWNEWAEGAYLEPDRAFGRAFLAETARVLARS
jgi:hypothetical protein